MSLLAGLGLPLRLANAADEPALNAFEQAYPLEIRPLLQRFCHECHAEKRTEAEIDLSEFATLADLRKDPQTWQKVGEMLDSAQMPPRKARQPSLTERTRLQEWVRGYLTVEARVHAGDPGRVVLRRLSNAEYTYTLRDLTGVESLDPAAEFPVDGAAGEGFTNTGNALVMSPALVTKYLDAAKDVASHAVLLPAGIRFSPHNTPRDWTEETLARIREFYREFTDSGGGEKVNLQGIVFDTNQGGRLPLEKYLAATIAEREALMSGAKSLEEVARKRGLNGRYLATLWKSLTGSEPSLLLDTLRARWRTAKPEETAALVAEIAAWQKTLWKFNTVGQIGKVGAPKAWQEPVSPLLARQDVRFKLSEPADGQDVTLVLVATDAGDGHDQDFVVWQDPRLVAPGRPDLRLRDVRDLTRDLSVRRQRMFRNAAKYLDAAQEAATSEGPSDPAELARKYEVEADALRAWLDYLGIGSGSSLTLSGHFTTKINNSTYDFIQGWGKNETPLLLANSSDQHVRIPGNMKPHSVAVHPSPSLRAAVGWRSPLSATLRVEAKVTHAHPECGNGVSWALELRRGTTRQRLASGTSTGSKEINAGPIENLAVQAGDLISVVIGPRDGNHACDLTAIELKLTNEGGRAWSLAEDVSSDVQAGNPHADRFGNDGVWHFYSEPDQGGGDLGPVIPNGSLLARWQTSRSAEDKQKMADAVQTLLTSGPPAARDHPDAVLYRQLTSLSGPLFRGALARPVGERIKTQTEPKNQAQWGLDPDLFSDGANLRVRAPSIVEIRLPADLVAGAEFVTTALLDKPSAGEGSVQLQVLASAPGALPGLRPGLPILVDEGSAARKRLEAALDDFRQLFPVVLCYPKIVPVDEVITLTLFYREDDQLARLMLDDEQRARLDALWDELHYVSQDALTQVDAFAQLLEYASQDGNPKVLEPLRKPIHDRAAAFRQRLIDTGPKHLEAVLDFAARADRRPLSVQESQALRAFYARLRREEIPHDEAIRLAIARVLVAPAFLYRVEKPGPGAGQGPVSEWELASRLSYFLWSSQPDDELRQVAAAGRLHEPEILVEQMKRMLGDPKTRRLATEFACQWLHIADFDHLDEKSERHFPTFAGLRGAMYEESIRFFTDLFQNDRSVLDILDADSTFLNADLAKHYGIPLETSDSGSASDWRRVEGIKRYGRGGILAQATTLAKQSGASRTSPTLRGNWISEVLLGERLPRPPKGVPQIPDDETATAGLTVRQLVEKHSSDAKCAVCHERIDPMGFALESFDAIGRKRELDLGDRPIDTNVKTKDGARFEGLDGLRGYLLKARVDAFRRQFCRKLLGYALGRSVILSDEPLLETLQTTLKTNDNRVVPALTAIVQSRQFREIRGRDTALDE